MKIAILITNPNHHFEMTYKVALRLKEEGHEPYYVSLCELRRMSTPVDRMQQLELSYLLQGKISKNLKPSSGARSLGSNRSFLRNLLRQLYWIVKLKPFISQALKKADKVLLMNDTAFPGNLIVNWLNNHNTPFYLLQEGIRFPIPGEGSSSYGNAGAEKILVWGERSANYFQTVKKNISEIVITGSPRFDQFVKEINELDQLKTNPAKILGVFTNPIDDQGFCTKDEKFSLFESFIKRASPYLEKEKISIGLKCHPREAIEDYLEIAQKYIKVSALDSDIKKAIISVDAGVIMASTVGLELLAASKSIAQLEIPNYGYVFDYCENESMLKIPEKGAFDLSQLFVSQKDTGYFKEHIKLGSSVEDITRVLLG